MWVTQSAALCVFPLGDEEEIECHPGEMGREGLQGSLCLFLHKKTLFLHSPNTGWAMNVVTPAGLCSVLSSSVKDLEIKCQIRISEKK